MTERELRRLSRGDLLELLLAQKKENDQMRQQLEELQAELESRRIAIDKAGSIAEASLALNGVFEAAQNACNQYTENIRLLSARQEEVCRRMEQETKEKCEKMVADVRLKAKAYWDEYMIRCQQYAAAHGIDNQVPVKEPGSNS